MGNVSSVGNPLSIINIQNPQQSGLDCIGYQYNKVFNTSCNCATGYTGSVKSIKTISGGFDVGGCSLISGNKSFILPSLIIPASSNSLIGTYGNLNAVYLANESNVLPIPTRATNTITIPNISISSTTSISFWFKTLKSPSQNIKSVIFSFGNLTTQPLEIFIQNDFVLLGGPLTQLGADAFPLYPNNWNHVAVIWTPSKSFLFYVNNNLRYTWLSDRTQGQYVSDPLLNGTITLGDSSNTQLRYPFAGYISDFRVYNRALIDSEILTIASIPPVSVPTIDFSNLLIWLQFNNNLYDTSGKNLPISKTGNVSYILNNVDPTIKSPFRVNTTPPIVLTNALINSTKIDYFNIITNNSSSNMYQCYVNIGYIDTSIFFGTSASISFNFTNSISNTGKYTIGLVFISSINNFSFPKIFVPNTSSFSIDTTNYQWPYNFNDGKVYNVYLTIISSSDLSNVIINNLTFTFNGPDCSSYAGFKNEYGTNGSCICDTNYFSKNSNTTFTDSNGTVLPLTIQNETLSKNIIYTSTSGLGNNGYTYYSKNGSVVYYYNNTLTPTQLTLSGCYPDPLLCPPGKYCPGGPNALNLSNQCPSGSYCKVGSTTPTTCSSGYFCPSGSSIQTLCPIGSYCTQGTGAPTPCSSGTYSSNMGTSSCQLCPSGYYCSVNSSMYTDKMCPSGYYCPTGSSSATTNVCPSGYYCTMGTTGPVQCPSGYYCPTQSTGAYNNPCPSGYYCPAGTGTYLNTVCPYGSYCPKNSFAPTLCPPGTFNANNNGKSLSDCTPCSAGTFTPINAGNTSCLAQFAGFITASPGSHQTTIDYTNVYNYYSPTTSVPAPAKITYKSSAKQVQSGYYSKGTTLATGNIYTGPSSLKEEVFLVDTSGGYAFTALQADVVAKDFGGKVATYAQLLDAYNNGADWCHYGWASGTTSDTTSTTVTNAYYPINISTGDGCSWTPSIISWPMPGAGVHVYGIKPSQSTPIKVSTITGTGYVVFPFVTNGQWNQNLATVQIPCNIGTYQDLVGQSSCKTCPVGGYCPSVGMSSQTNCPVGTYQDATGQTSCKTCPVGAYCPSVGMSSKTNCSAGTYQDATGQTSCKTCPAGAYCPSVGMSSPTYCTTGQYSTDKGQTSSSTCKTCPAGSYCPSISSTPTSCPAGKYSNSGKTDSNDCIYFVNPPSTLMPDYCHYYSVPWSTIDTSCVSAYGQGAKSYQDKSQSSDNNGCGIDTYKYACIIPSTFYTKEQIQGFANTHNSTTTNFPGGFFTTTVPN